ncbi:MAG: ATP-binding protein [Acholeplasmataceae bacterium]|nr:ATP-binding protein [Acholeplasmataceae bacterium]
MRMNSFKVGGFKVFGDVIEFNMRAGTRNTTHLKENLLERKVNNLIVKNLKSAIIYGGNNTGKSSLLQAIMVMKRIFQVGSLDTFPFDEYKNFSFNNNEIVKFEIDFNCSKDNYVYGMEFKDEKAVGEYLFLNEELLFSRDLNGNLEGDYLDRVEGFKSSLNNLSLNKLVVPYFLKYQKEINGDNHFKIVKDFFNKIIFIDNRRNEYNFDLLMEFINNKHKLNVLNELIKTTELYLEGRTVILEDDLLKDELDEEMIKAKGFKEFRNKDDTNDEIKHLKEALKIRSLYYTKDGKIANKPSILFDSVGTNKFLNLSMAIINALIDEKILLIDEFDSSFHHKLTRTLVILINSKANKNSQFILTSYDVSLLSNQLFRKDQVNFIIRTNTKAEVVSLDDFKANSESDIRNTSNFKKLYLEEKIVPLPNTNIYEVIKEIIKG